MKKLLFLVLLGVVLLTIVNAYADRKTYITTRSIDFDPNDGFMDAGTSSNPFVLEDESGQEIGTMKSRNIDFEPNDGFMDAGTPSNPMVIDWND